MIPVLFYDRLAWVARCGAPACHATIVSRSGEARVEAEKRAEQHGWRFSATPLCPLHARKISTQKGKP